MKKKSNHIDTDDYLVSLNPVFTIRHKNLKAQYYSDGSGAIRVINGINGLKIFESECDKLKDHIKDLEENVKAMKKAISLLKKEKKAHKL